MGALIEEGIFFFIMSGYAGVVRNDEFIGSSSSIPMNNLYNRAATNVAIFYLNKNASPNELSNRNWVLCIVERRCAWA